MTFELVVAGLNHRYGALSVLEDIGFTLRQGEILAIVGPSGCGKSTLLGILGGLAATDAAAASRCVGDMPPDSLNPFTYIFQDFALLPWRTVAGNVALALEHHRCRAPIARRASPTRSLAPA